MKKIKLLLLGIGLFSFIGAYAQVSVENENTVKLGSGNNSVNADIVGKYGQALGVQFGSSSSYNKGTLIEAGNAESAGIYMDGDKIVIWSPGDANLVNFCDEDLMGGANTGYSQATIAYIDGSGSFYTNSDSIRKEQIAPITSSLSKVMQLKGVEYYYKKNNGTTSKDKETNDKSDSNKEKKSGFLAQEVERIVPGAVSTNNAGVKFVNYQAIIPYLVEAIKEQQTLIDQQQKENQKMKDEIEQIQQTLKSVKTN